MIGREQEGKGLPGRMQPWGVTLDRLIVQAARWHGRREIVWRRADGSIGRSDYAALEQAARRISSALLDAGIRPGDRIATLASNNFDHLAIWYGAMGVGIVCHTLNPRLHADQLVFIANHAGDRLLFADVGQAALVEQLLPRCPMIGAVHLINGTPEGLPYSGLSDFVGTASAEVAWGGFDENMAAGLCYTSGTTGNPKGVLYSHRSNYMLAMNTSLPDAFGLSSRDVIMPVVPMYHANTWGLAFSAVMVGAKLVLPGTQLDGAALHELIEGEGVTFSAGVPTVWQSYVDHLRAIGVDRSGLKRVVIGGSACPAMLMEAMEALGVEVIHAWGMTELSPVGLAATPTPDSLALPPAEQRQLAAKQGHPVGIDAMIVDDAQIPLPHDGESAGRLMVRGPAVIDRYYGVEESALEPGGWFDTGDIATIDPQGFVRITDRAKDIIKSGGEWISSVDIENMVMAHPNVAQAAVVAIAHPKWGERPKLYVQERRPGENAPGDFITFLDGRIARWWMPDEVEIIDAIPIGSTGKIDKKALRALAGAGEGAPVSSAR
ncbi:long-chain fatty acid--CoA ligase [Sphingomonas sp. YL-JM2C]